MKPLQTKAKAGRPRTFDAEQALDCAMKVFWEKGYEGSSLPELTKAMGMNRPSLYAVFGNKEALFHKALERYSDTRMQFFDAALALPTARAVVERLLIQYIDAQTEPGAPHGCMGVNAALACSDDALPIRDELAARRLRNEIKLRDRLARAKEEGDVPADACPEQLARYVMTLSQGMAVQAAAGVSREQLHQLVAMLLRGWPA
ncbi:TetR/AcrR family transcriptional regulator [Janthinobacterium sp.]|uniref:TetR/AcrR family transcriptional regulator n=1 Tax=Janthinobacterium sp. TaxID=1871054 RepID=UPI00293D2E83|nr:TetR/AcrR family transcriptional regulator [Janthinobacterium sp.]